MLTPALRSQFVTKIVSTEAGAQYRVLFLVSLVNGQPVAQVVSAELISAPEGHTAPSACLPACIQKAVAEFSYIPASAPKVDFSDALEFLLVSQPTRAPSFI